jgi:hypothetical protein
MLCIAQRSGLRNGAKQSLSCCRLFTAAAAAAAVAAVAAAAFDPAPAAAVVAATVSAAREAGRDGVWSGNGRGPGAERGLAGRALVRDCSGRRGDAVEHVERRAVCSCWGSRLGGAAVGLCARCHWRYSLRMERSSSRVLRIASAYHHLQHGAEEMANGLPGCRNIECVVLFDGPSDSEKFGWRRGPLTAKRSD